MTHILRRQRNLDTPRASTNASLWLDKFLDVQSGHPNYSNAKDDPGAGAKSRLIQQASSIKIPEGYGRAFQRWLAGHMSNRCIDVTTSGRLAIGLGAKSVLEVGLTLHPTWGMPFLPGSALKGLASRVAHQLLEGAGWKRPDNGTTADASHARDPMHKHHAFLFGTTANEGAVIFHDAWWQPQAAQTTVPIAPDVMTVHHAEYYQGNGNTPPSDFDSPNPVGFATVYGTFIVVLEKRDSDIDDSWLEVATQLVAKGLTEVGVGAKTNAGYGRFSVAGSLKNSQPGSPTSTSDPIAEASRLASLVAANNAASKVADAQLVFAGNGAALKAFAKVAAEKLGPRFLRDKADKAYVKWLEDTCKG